MDVRVRETNLGNAVADALLDYGQSDVTHKSNLAVTNGGGLRETIC
nr:5'-nucleotidase C-terminal domain-containing protein [Streptococcus thermophilus]